MANLRFKEAIDVAVLVTTLTAIIWNIWAMFCLYLLRRRNPELFGSYRAPVHHILPGIVIVLSAFAVYVYSGIDNAQYVIALTAALYVLGLGYYAIWGRHCLQAAAPEELAARTHGAAE